MKKKVLSAILVSAMLCAFAGCGSKPAETTTTTQAAAQSADTAKSEATAADIAAAVLEEIPIASAFEKKQETLGDYFDGMDVSSVDDFNYTICASGAYPDEIGIFHFSSSDAAKAALPVFEARLQYQKDMYKDYTPDEYYKLEDAVIKQDGSWVWYLVTSNNSRANDIVQGKL